MKFNKIFSFIAVGMMSLGFAACSDSEPEYTQGVPANKDGVHFSNIEGNSINLTQNQNMIEVNLYREKADDDLTVKLSASDVPGLPAGTFDVPASVHFAKGVKMAVVGIPVIFANIEPNTEYPLTISIDLADSTPYGVQSKTFNVAFITWTSWRLVGTGVWTYTALWKGALEVPVYVRQSTVDRNIYEYRCGNFGDPNIPENQQDGPLNGVNYYITYNAADGSVSFPPTNTEFMHPTYNEYVWCSGASDYIREVAPAAAQKPAFLRPNSFDTETGLVALNMYYYISLGGWGPSYEYLQIPGYVNYKVEVEANGRYIDGNGKESQVLSIYMPESIKEAKYQVYSGTLTEAEAEAKAKGLDDDENAKTLDASDNVAFEITEGKYTVVVAGYDEEGQYRSFAYLTFDFASDNKD